VGAEVAVAIVAFGTTGRPTSNLIFPKKKPKRVRERERENVEREKERRRRLVFIPFDGWFSLLKAFGGSILVWLKKFLGYFMLLLVMLSSFNN